MDDVIAFLTERGVEPLSLRLSDEEVERIADAVVRKLKEVEDGDHRSAGDHLHRARIRERGGG